MQQKLDHRNMTYSDTIAWQEVVYSPKSTTVPLERWGHRLIRTSPTQLLLFGGFGGENAEANYLEDLWEFNLSTYEWRQLAATGDQPEKRSNYSIHYNSQDHQVILFAGGASNKIRFNSICLLDLNTMIWTKVDPDTTEQAPWERTYHSSEFSYPYLITFGGEGVSNLDLEDCWTYNVTTNAWKKLMFEGECGPGRRRFHSSALIGSHFYVIGGCRDNYEMVGSIFRTDLKALFEEGSFEGFYWEKLLENKSLERWGHTSDVYNNKLYIFAGRVSSTTDTNDILCFDPVSNTLSQMKVKSKSAPQPRRRHASVLVGRSLLCFGGYNGRYLKDFAYIALPNGQPPSCKLNIVLTETAEEQARQMEVYEKKIQKDWRVDFVHQNGKASLPTKRKIFLENQFFKLTHKYQGCDKLTIQLPIFCTMEMFRCIHLMIMQGDAIFNKQRPPSYFFDLISAIEYFNCPQFIPAVENHLISLVCSSNCEEMLGKAVELQLRQLQLRAAEIYLKAISLNQDQETRESEASTNHNFASKTLEPNEILRAEPSQNRFANSLGKIQHLIRLQIDQEQLRINSPSLLVRAAQQIKRIFVPSDSNEQKESTEKQQPPPEPNKGCLSRMLDLLDRINFLRWRRQV